MVISFVMFQAAPTVRLRLYTASFLCAGSSQVTLNTSSRLSRNTTPTFRKVTGKLYLHVKQAKPLPCGFRIHDAHQITIPEDIFQKDINVL